jgi:hypothetical protein
MSYVYFIFDQQSAEPTQLPHFDSHVDSCYVHSDHPGHDDLLLLKRHCAISQSSSGQGSAMSYPMKLDVKSYTTSKKPVSFDRVEFLRFVLCTVLTAPPNYYWQGWLERTWPGYEVSAMLLPSKDDLELAERGWSDNVAEKEKEKQLTKLKFSKKNTMIKWFVDCITLGAVFNTVAFLLIIGVLKGTDMATIRHKIRDETIPIIVVGYRVWPIASIINFTFIRWERRIVLFSCIGFFWGIYMSLISAHL